MAQGLPFRDFDCEKEKWELYKQQLEQHFVMNNIEECMKKTMLINHCDAKTSTLLRDLCTPKTPAEKSYEELCDLLTKHFGIPSNEESQSSAGSSTRGSKNGQSNNNQNRDSGKMPTQQQYNTKAEPLPCSSGSTQPKFYKCYSYHPHMPLFALPDDIPTRKSFPTPDEEIKAKLQEFSKIVNLERDQTDIEEIVQLLKDLGIEPDYYHAAIHQLLIDNIERDARFRDLVALVVSQMFEKKVITKADYLHALEEMFTVADDLIIDIPQVYNHLSSFFVTLLKQRYISLNDIRNVAQSVLQKSGATLLKELLLLYEALYGKDATIMLWHDSFLGLTDFIKTGSPEAAVQYLADANLGYMFDPNSDGLSMETVGNQLKYLLKANVMFMEIYNWMSRHVSRERKTSNEFIRTIMRAMLEHCVDNKTLNVAEFIKWYPILQKYIDGEPERELNAMYAIQRLIVELEHPQNLLQSILEQILYNDVLSEGIALWLESTDPLEASGKRVCLEGITRFIEMYIYKLVEDAEE